MIPKYCFYSWLLPLTAGRYSGISQLTAGRNSVRSLFKRERLESRNISSFREQTGQLKTTQSLPELVGSDAQRRTIFALSTPPGKAGVAIIRVSGPDALNVWNSVVRPVRGKRQANTEHKTTSTNATKNTIPTPWKMERCEIVKPGSGELIDDGLAVFFKGPRSFTTEDVVELHIHSGRAVVASLLSSLSSLSLTRPAEPGEFTRRAFLGGRLDLTQVEGLKDLIDAETEGQRRSALRATGGALRKEYDNLRTGIIHCLAMIEALIDFGEGDDIEEGVYEQARVEASTLLDTINMHLSDNRRGEIIRSGIKLAIFGPPNAGKSSLLNFLAQRPAAIVTPHAGTTRDILELSLDIAGLPIRVSDTAGLRGTEDEVERIGVGRAVEAVKDADIALCVLSLPDVLIDSSPFELEIRVPAELEDLITPHTLFLLNKIDLLNNINVGNVRLRLQNTPDVFPAWTASISTRAGMNDFLADLGTTVNSRFSLDSANAAQTPVITRARHRVHLEQAAKFLRAFLAYSSDDIVFGAEELRYAASAVGRVSGLIDVEDILDAVFRNFCIGK